MVATDATLNKVQAKRLAIMAQVGIAHAIRPVHTPLDGDLVFTAATGRRPLPDPIHGLAELGSAAADVLARAVARAVYEATALPVPGRPAGLARPFWNNWITAVPKGPAALTLPSRWLANVDLRGTSKCGARW